MGNIKSNLSISTDAIKNEISLIYCYFRVIDLLNLKGNAQDELGSQQRLFLKSFRQKKRIKMKMIKQEILISVIKIYEQLSYNLSYSYKSS